MTDNETKIKNGKLAESNFRNTIVGKYKFKKWENLETFLQYLDLGFVSRKVLSLSKPVLEVDCDSLEIWTLKTTSTFRSYKVVFKLGKMFEDYSFDFRPCEAVAGIKDDKLIVKQKCISGPDIKLALFRGENANEIKIVYKMQLPNENSQVRAKQYFTKIDENST